MSLSLLTLATAALQAAPAPAEAPRLGRFSDLPNVTVAHYDVQGENVRAVHKSIDEQAPRDPATNRAIPATSDWSVSALVQTGAAGPQCKVTTAKLNFAANAKLPRLVPMGAAPIAPSLLARWQAYVAQLEDRQVAQLRFAHDRLGRIEQEILASSCNDWKAVATAAIDKLKKDKAATRAKALPPPRLED